MDLTAANLDILFRQVSTLYQQGLITSSTFYNEIATTFPMATREINMAFLDRVPQMRQWTGTRILNNAFAQSRTITAAPWEDTVSVDVFDLADEAAPLFGNAVQMLGAAAAKWPDKMLANFLINNAAATSASPVNGYDGVPVYSTAHPILGGVAGAVPAGAPATQSNLNVSTPLTLQNYIASWQQMAAWQGADGAPMGVMPDVLMVGPNLAGAAKLILESDFIAAGALTSTSNATQTNVWKNTTRLLINPWLTAKPNHWWLLDTRSVMKPFGFFQREAPTFTALTAPNDANVFLNHQLTWGVQARGAAAETVWWLSCANTGDGSY